MVTLTFGYSEGLSDGGSRHTQKEGKSHHGPEAPDEGRKETLLRKMDKDAVVNRL